MNKEDELKIERLALRITLKILNTMLENNTNDMIDKIATTEERLRRVTSDLSDLESRRIGVI